MDALRAKRPATQWGLIKSALGGTNRFSCGVNIMLYVKHHLKIDFRLQLLDFYYHQLSSTIYNYLQLSTLKFNDLRFTDLKVVCLTSMEQRFSHLNG